MDILKENVKSSIYDNWFELLDFLGKAGNMPALCLYFLVTTDPGIYTKPI